MLQVFFGEGADEIEAGALAGFECFFIEFEVAVEEARVKVLGGSVADKHVAEIIIPGFLAVGRLDHGGVVFQRDDLTFGQDFGVDEAGVVLTPFRLLEVQHFVDGVFGFAHHPEDGVAGAEGDDAIGGREAAAHEEDSLITDMFPFMEIVLN